MKTLPALAVAALFLTVEVQAADYPALTGATLARTFPYSMIGQLSFDSGPDGYIGSGTVIAPSSVLTAGHNLYDYSTGWSTSMVFYRGLYGYQYISRQAASRLYVLAGYQTAVANYGPDANRSFARDMGGVIFSKLVANGGYARWKNNLSLLTGSAYNLCLGYGGEFHTGEYLLSVAPNYVFTSTYGAFLENSSIYIEAGMSGGPVLAQPATGGLVVTGVVVSGSTQPVTGGIRAIDTGAADFIRTYFR